LSDFAAEYSENSSNGVQSINVYLSDSKSNGRFSRSSRTELIANCARQSTPRPFKRYSNEPGPVPPLPKKPIRGLYNLGPSVYIEFFENGYVKLETEEPANGDCVRRHPSGMPICATYAFNGRTLTINNVESTVKVRARANQDGLIEYVQHFNMTPVEPLDKKALVGSWISESGSVGDINMCILGYCSSSVSKKLFHFLDDGRFLDETGGRSFTSVNVTGVSLGANNNNRSKQYGDYTVDGAYINLKYDSGKEVTIIGFRPDNVFLNLGNNQFLRH